MTKYNVKNVPVTPTEINEMGEKAFKLSAQEELVSTALTTFIQSSYYESENEIVNRLIKAADQCDPYFVAKLALYVRKEANMRSVSHLLGGYLATLVKGKTWGSKFYHNLAVRVDDMAEIVAFLTSNKKKVPAAVRKGFKLKMEDLDPYLIDKYKMSGKKVSLIDLVRLTHPKVSPKNAEAYERLVYSKNLSDLYTSKILDREKSKGGDKGQAIIETIEANGSKMPIMNLLRNLRDIILFAPEKVDFAISLLTDKKKIKNSRLLPFRFASAYAEVEKLKGIFSSGSSEVVFEGEKISSSKDEVNKVLSAIEKALKLSCDNIPVFNGNTAILIDHSGSMRGDIGGGSLVSTFSSVNTSLIADVFAALMLNAQENVYVGLFGDRLVSVDINRKKGIFDHIKTTNKLGETCGGSTENGLYHFLKDVIKNKKNVDNFIIFSDMVIGDGRCWDVSSTEKDFHGLFKDFKKINPKCNVISVDLKQTGGTTVFNGKYGVHQVSGWSDKIFDVMQGRSGYTEIIEEIEKIDL